MKIIIHGGFFSESGVMSMNDHYDLTTKTLTIENSQFNPIPQDK